ncbi:unnamed protein product [Anisakis simplex]|uniref:Uncharacterized protein n=1 Tax=Anisakis simplex TaxID=6269 RepID=A0A0M3J257_ANISI|nr:unnamed protein product [Anisakis simplex]
MCHSGRVAMCHTGVGGDAPHWCWWRCAKVEDGQKCQNSQVG